MLIESNQLTYYMEGTILITGMTMEAFWAEMDRRYRPATDCGDDAPLDAKGAAEYLRRTEPAIYHLVGAGELPHFKKQGRLYFYKAIWKNG